MTNPDGTHTVYAVTNYDTTPSRQRFYPTYKSAWENYDRLARASLSVHAVAPPTGRNEIVDYLNQRGFSERSIYLNRKGIE